ncbi:MAG: RluA family pseudouridine synthase [Bacteroidota bacterium]
MQHKSTRRPLRKEAKETILTVESEDELLKFLLQNLSSKSRNLVKSVLKNKQISVNGKPTTKFDYALHPGDSVKVNWDIHSVEEPFKGIKIIFEDEYLIVIQKQAGILSISTDEEKEETAYSMLWTHVKSERTSNKIFVVHRLDRDTSGIMLFAKTFEIKKQLQESWLSTILERTYIAVVEGHVENEKDTIISYLKETKSLIVYSDPKPSFGQKAITHYEVMRHGREYTMLKVNLETGRKNQIRVHMKEIGHSIAGDRKYGAKTNPLKRLGLHAQVLSFTHPVTNEDLSFETGIPREFKKLFF